MIIGLDPSTSESPIVGTCITGATFVGPTHVSLGPRITNSHTGTISMARRASITSETSSPGVQSVFGPHSQKDVPKGENGLVSDTS